MCRAIQDEFESITDNIDWADGKLPRRTEYIEAFDKGLTEYVEKNMEIEYGWSAQLPPPASSPDPVQSFVSGLSIADKTIGQPQSAAVWGNLIRACFARAVIQHPAAFLIPPGSLLTAAPLIIAPPPGGYPAPLLNICETVYAWLIGSVNPAPLAGNHSPFIGATTGMAIR